MNLLIIISEAIVLKSFNKYWRKIVAAIVASLFDCISLFFSKIYFVQIIISYVIIYIAFKPLNFKVAIKNIFLFYFISFLFGGISFAILNVTEANITIINGIITGKFLLIKILASSFIGLTVVTFVLKRKNEHLYKDIVVGFKGSYAKLKVLLDTGNLLRDPYNGKNVIVVEKNALKELFDDDFLENFRKILLGEKELPLGMFLIPYKSLGNSNDFLIGFKPDSIYVENKTNKSIYGAVIGICNECLSDNKLYSGIFGLESFDDLTWDEY